MTENSLPSPAVLQRYLHGVDYPATKDQLVAHVRSQCEQATGDAQSECERPRSPARTTTLQELHRIGSMVIAPSVTPAA